MRNLLLTLSYDGRAYCGWQIQKNAPTVQGELQRALTEAFGDRPDIKGCSRTDSGVHAREFCVSMKTDSRIPCERVPTALNTRLPRDIAVRSCHEVEDSFHARYSALGKRYEYLILNTPVRDPFYRGLALHHPYPLDESLLSRCAGAFIGRHDFAAFQASGSSVRDTVRTVSDCNVRREGELVIFSVTADGFLYNMVRIMVGTLLSVSAGRLTEDELPEVILSRRRERAGVTAPPDGLYLDKVYYPFTT